MVKQQNINNWSISSSDFPFERKEKSGNFKNVFAKWRKGVTFWNASRLSARPWRPIGWEAVL